MSETKRIKDFLTLNSIGFFQRIDAKLAAMRDPEQTPWSSYITSAELDNLYYLNNKYKKVSEWWEDMEGDTSEGKDAIASMLWGIYGVKWAHLFKIFQAQYDPLENYDRQENTTETTEHTGQDETTRTPDLEKVLAHTGQDTDTRTPDLEKVLAHTGQDTDTRTPDLERVLDRTGSDTDERTPSLTRGLTITNDNTDNTEKRATFNSGGTLTPVAANKAEHGSTNTETTTGNDTTIYTKGTTDTETENGTEITTHAKATTDTETESGTETTTHAKATTDTETEQGTETTTLTRDTTDTRTVIGRIHGNIGVTTAAQMMEMDKRAWDALKLIEGMLMDDLNEQLTIPIY